MEWPGVLDTTREDGRGRVTGDALDIGGGGAWPGGPKDSEPGGISIGIGSPMSAGGQGRDLWQL